MGVADLKTFSVGAEATWGLPVAVDHPLEALPSSKFTWTANRKQGEGMRVGGTFGRSGRRTEVSAEGAGNLDMELLSKGQGLIWKAIIGSATTTLVSGTTYQNLFTRPTTVLPSLTVQKAIQGVDGTVRPETYSGCTCTDWELSFDNNDIVKLATNWDVRDINTNPTTVSTTLSSAASIGATSISVAATIPAGSMILINSAEARYVTGVSGVGPYTLTFVKPLTLAASSSNPVVAQGYVAPSYAAGGNLYSFAGLSIYNGTITAPTTTTLASGTTIMNGLVRSGSISINNSVLDRYLAGDAGRQAQQRLGVPVGTVKLSMEFVDATWRDAYLNDRPTSLVLNFTAGSLSTGLETIQIVVSEMKPNQDMPDGDGTDVGLLDMEFTILDNLTAAQPLWVVQRTSDTAV